MTWLVSMPLQLMSMSACVSCKMQGPHHNRNLQEHHGMAGSDVWVSKPAFAAGVCVAWASVSPAFCVQAGRYYLGGW